MIEVFFFDKNKKQFDYCSFSLSEDKDFEDDVEEILFIKDELIPAHSNWKHDIQMDKKCLFKRQNYPGIVIVEIGWDEKRDMPIVLCTDA